MPSTEDCGEPILVVPFYTWPSSRPGKGMRWLPAAIVAVKKKKNLMELVSRGCFCV